MGLFKKYDADLDGNLSIVEFGQLIDDLHPGLSTPQIEQMYKNLIAIGDGKINAEHLNIMVMQINHRDEGAKMSATELEDPGLGEEEFISMTRAWDSVRVAAEEMDPARLLHFEESTSIIIKLQAQFRARLTRARVKVAAKHESRAPKVVTLGGALGF